MNIQENQIIQITIQFQIQIQIFGQSIKSTSAAIILKNICYNNFEKPTLHAKFACDFRNAHEV